MGAILWEDSLQQVLRERHQYTGHTALMEQPVENTTTDREAHISYATRRSRYFKHTKKGKRYASRPVVRVDVSDNWRGKW